MKHFICLLILVFGFNLNVCLAQNDEGKIIEPIHSWSGKGTSNERLKAAPEKDYVSDKAEWEELWRAWRASEEAVPTIDFTKNLVAFCTAQTPNGCGIKLLLSETGDLRIQTFSTLIGGNSTTFDYQFVEFSQAGVKTINGQGIRLSKATRPEAQTRTPREPQQSKGANSKRRANKKFSKTKKSQ